MGFNVEKSVLTTFLALLCDRVIGPQHFSVGITARILAVLNGVWKAVACSKQELAGLLTSMVHTELIRLFHHQGL